MTAETAFLRDGGEVGAILRARDWASTPLGPAAGWPVALKTAVRLMLNCGHPMYIFWGSEAYCFYNDAYRPSTGAERHPSSLGQPARPIWHEIWPVIGPQIEQVMRGEGSTWHENELIPMTRDGQFDSVYWTYSYSPIHDETAGGTGVGGVLVVCYETTARVLAEQRADAEHRRLASLFEQAPGFIAMLTGPEHRVTLSNAAHRRLNGHRDILGRPIAEALPDVAAQGYVDLLDQVFRSGEPYHASNARYAMRVVPGGPIEERFVDFVFEPMKDVAGTVTGIFLEGHDVTARVRSEAARAASDAARAASDQRLQTLSTEIEARVVALADERGLVWQLSPDLLGVLNADGVFETTNPAWQTLLGWTATEVATMTIFELIHPDDIARTRAAFDHILAGNKVTRFENRYRARAGGYRDISWAAVPDGGKIYGIGRDVTAEKQAARDVADAEARRRAVFETSQMFQTLLTPDGTVLDANATSLAVIGRRLDEVVGVRFAETPWFAGTPGLPALIAEAVRSAAAGTAIRREIHVDLPVGGWNWYDFVIRPMVGTDGTVVAIVPEAVDITARKAVEDALRQSQKLEAIGQLTGGVAHDFNNLLTPIVGGLDILARRGLGGEREARLIDGALQSAERARTLVQRLLAFARRQPLQPVAVDIAGLVDGMADLIGSASSPNVAVVVDIAPGLPPAVADTNQLEMALLNLAVNARDAMPGGGTLTITGRHDIIASGAQPDLAPGPYICLTVADTGVGMDAATRGRAVEPFFSTKGVGKGTGLGLSMVHGLASQLGGGLAIDSVPGAGTTVVLWLPAGTGVAVPVAANGAARVPGSGTILLVDDEAIVRCTTAAMLADLGFAVIEAASGDEALALLAIHQVDVLVTDHLMPGMRGDALVRRVRAERPGLPALIVSGFAQLADIPTDLPRLAKPFRRDELAASIADLRPVD